MMKNGKSILLLCLVFAAGLVMGIVGTRSVLRHAIRQTMAHPERAQLILELDVARRLRLNDDQQTRLHDIMAGAHLQMREIRLQMRPQVVVVVSNINQQISGMLTPEQLRRYEKLKSENSPALQFPRQPR